jgi:hypothetical protein
MYIVHVLEEVRFSNSALEDTVIKPKAVKNSDTIQQKKTGSETFPLISDLNPLWILLSNGNVRYRTRLHISYTQDQNRLNIGSK